MKSKIINLDKPLWDIDGKPIENGKSLGQILGNHLVAGSKGDPLKFFDWAVKFNRGETVELDRSDYEKLKEFVTNCETMTILAKGQILPLLENDKPITEATL